MCSTQDKVSSSEGGAALDGQYYPREAFVIQKARAAGCVIVGHSNLVNLSDDRADNRPRTLITEQPSTLARATVREAGSLATRTTSLR